MNDDRKEVIRKTIMGLEDADYTTAGEPKVNAINANLPEGEDHVTAEERDEVWGDMRGENEAGGTTGDRTGTATPDMETPRPAENDQAGDGESGGEVEGTAEAQTFDGAANTIPQTAGGMETPRVAENDLAGTDAQVEGDMRDSDGNTARVRIEESPAGSPFPLYVHGVGRWELRESKIYDLPEEALAALRDAGVKFTREDR